MDEYDPLYSEEDIRTKVVTAWLADHGFGPSDIAVEYSFEIRLGRKILPINSEQSDKALSQVFRPRAEVLVRSCDGRNLLIVEVKASDEPLDENAREQGICYARLLRKGGIAPFVVLTNGHETQIYDSISEELINDRTIPLNHPHVKAGFRVSADDMALRTEALETFISLSPENLIEFCRQQVSYRMRFLRDEDPFSGKKYIPSLYIERKEAKKNLIRLLDDQKRRVVIVVGPPQVGKTNFICHTVAECLEQGLPCLFYPAIGMEKGLLGEICDDFEWIFGDVSPAYNIIHRRLQRILSQTGQKLTIFIDGWNEAHAVLARIIDRESERLAYSNISCVISMTNIAAGRLLMDEAGNPSHIAEAAGITASVVPLLEISPEKEDNAWSKVLIGQFRNEEVKEAYQKYAEIFNVQISQAHQYVEDPFLLRIGMEVYQGQALPDTLDEPKLLEQSICMKADRAGDLKGKCVPVFLSELADEIFRHDAPIRVSVMMKRWSLPIVDEPPKGLFEAALLAKVCNDQGFYSLDFYSSRERDFTVACWARGWLTKLLEEQQSIVSELTLVAKTRAGLDAIRWFLGQPKHEEQLRIVTRYFSLYENLSIRRCILSSICEIICKSSDKNRDWIYRSRDWIQSVLDEGTRDVNLLVRVEAAKLIAIFTEDAEQVLALFDSDEETEKNIEELTMNLLLTEEEYPLRKQSIGLVVLDALRGLYRRLGGGNERSELTDLLGHLMNHGSSTIRIGAANVFGYMTPYIFLQGLSNRITLLGLDDKAKTEYMGGVEMAVGELQEIYYGSMCQGALEALVRDSEQLCNEYARMCELCMPTIALYSSGKCGRDLLNILRSLQPEQNVLEGRGLPTIEQIKAKSSNLAARRYQLPLPFDDLGISIGRN